MTNKIILDFIIKIIKLMIRFVPPVFAISPPPPVDFFCCAQAGAVLACGATYHSLPPDLSDVSDPAVISSADVGASPPPPPPAAR